MTKVANRPIANARPTQPPQTRSQTLAASPQPRSSGWRPNNAALAPAEPAAAPRFGKPMFGFQTNPRVPAPMATWARKALGAVSPQNNPNGDGVRQLFGRQDLGKLPQGVQQSLLRDAALHGVDVHDSFSFVAQQSVGGRSVFVVAHSPTAKAEQRVEVMTEQGLALGQRTINLKDVDGPMQTQGGRSPSYRWPTAA